MSRLVRYFFQGLILLVPLAVTAYVLWAVFSLVDGWLDLGVPGAGIAIVVVGATLVGFVANLFLVRPVVRVFEAAIGRLPFVKVLYGAIKDLLSAVFGDEKRFDRAVRIEIHEGIEVIGFVTRDSLEELGIADRVAVYLPQSYNFAGQTLLVAPDRIRPLDASGADAMTFLVSAGVAGVKDGPS